MYFFGSWANSLGKAWLSKFGLPSKDPPCIEAMHDSDMISIHDIEIIATDPLLSSEYISMSRQHAAYISGMDSLKSDM